MHEQQQESNIISYTQSVYAKRERWQMIIDEWQSNPIRPREFCSKNNLNLDQFGYWRRKFASNTGETNTPYVAPGFIEVTSSNKQALRSSSQAEVNLTMPNNIQLSIAVSISHMAELIAQLGAARC